MSQTNDHPQKTPIAEGLLLPREWKMNYRLTDEGRCGSLDPAIYQDSQSIAQNPVYLAIASQKHCENRPHGWLSFKKAQIFVLRLALLIFKSGLNRILLTELRSGAATPKKMFLMLARLSEITNQNDGLGQQQLLIDNYQSNKG